MTGRQCSPGPPTSASLESSACRTLHAPSALRDLETRVDPTTLDSMAGSSPRAGPPRLLGTLGCLLLLLLCPARPGACQVGEARAIDTFLALPPPVARRSWGRRRRPDVGAGARRTGPLPHRRCVPLRAKLDAQFPEPCALTPWGWRDTSSGGCACFARHPTPHPPTTTPAAMHHAPPQEALHGWEVVEEANVTEYSAVGTLYRHRTGATGGCVPPHCVLLRVERIKMREGSRASLRLGCYNCGRCRRRRRHAPGAEVAAAHRAALRWRRSLPSPHRWALPLPLPHTCPVCPAPSFLLPRRPMSMSARRRPASLIPQRGRKQGARELVRAKACAASVWHLPPHACGKNLPGALGCPRSRTYRWTGAA